MSENLAIPDEQGGDGGDELDPTFWRDRHIDTRDQFKLWKVPPSQQGAMYRGCPDLGRPRWVAGEQACSVLYGHAGVHGSTISNISSAGEDTGHGFLGKNGLFSGSQACEPRTTNSWAWTFKLCVRARRWVGGTFNQAEITPAASGTHTRGAARLAQPLFPV